MILIERNLTEEKTIEIATPLVKEIANRIAQNRYEELEDFVELKHFSTNHLKHIIEGQMQQNDISHLDQIEEDDLIAENICCEEIYEDEKGFRMAYEFSEDKEACGIFLELEFFYTSTDEVKAEIPISEDMPVVEIVKDDLKKIVNLISDKKYEELAQIAEMGELTSEVMKNIVEGHLEINDLPDHMDHFSNKKYYDIYDEEVNGGIYDNEKGIWIEYHFSAEGEPTDLTLQVDFLFTDDRNVCTPVICGFNVM